MLNIPDILEKAANAIKEAKAALPENETIQQINADDLLAVLNAYGTAMLNLRDMTIVAIGFEPEMTKKMIAAELHLKFGDGVIVRKAIFERKDAETIMLGLENSLNATKPGKIIIPGAGGLA